MTARGQGRMVERLKRFLRGEYCYDLLSCVIVSDARIPWSVVFGPMLSLRVELSWNYASAEENHQRCL